MAEQTTKEREESEMTSIEKARKDLQSYIEELEKEEINGCLDAEWMRERLSQDEWRLEELFGDQMAWDVSELEKALNSSDAETQTIKNELGRFEGYAISTGRHQWDEDFGEVPGYQYETIMAIRLRNIAAEALELPTVDWRDYYDDSPCK